MEVKRLVKLSSQETSKVKGYIERVKQLKEEELSQKNLSHLPDVVAANKIKEELVFIENLIKSFSNGGVDIEV